MYSGRNPTRYGANISGALFFMRSTKLASLRREGQVEVNRLAELSILALMISVSNYKPAICDIGIE